MERSIVRVAPSLASVLLRVAGTGALMSAPLVARRIWRQTARTTVRRAKVGPVAVIAAAVGAFAVGAFSIGALAVGKLVVGSLRIGRLTVDQLEVRQATPVT
jgi:hypothetical protein